MVLAFVALALAPYFASAQYYDTYPNIAALKSSCQLIEGQTYVITDMSKLQIMAASCSTFHTKPLYSRFCYEYDELQFNFDTRIMTGIDNCEGIIRCNNGWYLINEATHKPHKISQANGNVAVHFTKTYDFVIGGSATLDETYSASGLIITCGPSIGLSMMTIWLHKTVNGAKYQLTLAEASIPGSNIFINARMGKNIQL